MKKTNNKGFSLVELIVVIAIMAVLVVAIAPQFLKYVERGRKSTDVQNVASIVTAVQTYAADPMLATNDKLVAGNATLSIGTTATTLAARPTGTTLADNLQKALWDSGIKEWKLSSSNWGSDPVVLTFTVAADGTVTVTAATMAAGHDIIKGQYQ